jgi:hypothetical protein
MRCGYEVRGMILLQAYLCTSSLLKGSPSKHSPSAAMHLAQNAVIVGNIFGTPVVEYLSMP